MLKGVLQEMRLGVSPSQNRARKSIQRVCFDSGRTYVLSGFGRLSPHPLSTPLYVWRTGPKICRQLSGCICLILYLAILFYMIPTLMGHLVWAPVEAAFG